MEVTRIHKIEGEGATKAFVDISLNDDLIVNGLRVVEGKDGLFVAMPRECTKDGKWYNTVIPLKRAVKDEIERIVLTAYDDDIVPTDTDTVVTKEGLNVPIKLIREETDNGRRDTKA